ncbi:hypothetical protein J2Z65_004391 [Paenibacillus aceris]|uniref:Serine protease n=1 Tax=Paenibacillus aceris TaxID=869555 RepID=A0ABS4I2N1_9BACL|nr:S1 family peptidase [Paenibacillus aceris]MBP1965158.1 hypothetical protein [Paenibacillus aceris]
MATFTAAYAMKERMARSMLKHPKVHAVGVGYQNPKRPDKGAAVTIYTDALSIASLGMASLLSVHGKGKMAKVPIRLVRTKKIRSHANYRSLIRPVPAGYSIGTSAGSGTVGLILTNFPSAKQRYIFSNNHVLTNPLNSGTPVETLQPGGADNGKSGKDGVGRLARFVQLSRKQSNFIDAALSIPVRNRILSPRYATVGVIPGHVTSYKLGERFKKVGRTTGLSYGRVDSINADVKVDYGENLGELTFKNQTIVLGSTPVSLPGDSGSVWLRRTDNFAAAVNFAGTTDGKTSIAFPVDWVMKAFQTRVARPSGIGRIRKVNTRDDNPAYARRLTAKELASIKIVQAKKTRK